MNLPPGVTIENEDSLEQFRWLGVNEDGTVRLFEDKPIKAGGTWVPEEFPDDYSSCYRLEDNYEDGEGGLFVRNQDNDFVSYDQ